MIYDIRLIHNESGSVAHLTVRARSEFEARAAAWKELARKGYSEPHAGAWRIFTLIEWPNSPARKGH